ncbi:hypothetical protein [Mediterraneibacter glycyrrhizinilyticus]|uniref:hypothetical protein n=1 Tax=Mediterraneibacter glycyrrhizinilyticus TaxID=342942 RepID=UPI00189CF61C|nr:hypothetical protein [Mediterraneibacter glycyrrhizinilyticus]
MKKRIGVVIFVFVLLFVSILAYNTFATDKNNKGVKKIATEWGEYLSSQFYQKDVKSSNTTNDDQKMEQVIKFYEIQGYNKKEAQKLAADYVEESDAIYQKAIEAGIRVTDDEVAAEVESIKQLYHSADLDEISKEQMEAIISTFKSEEDYWEYEREVYQTLLVSQKYVNTILEDFFTSHPEASYADWSAYFEDWKDQLIADQ